MARMPEPRIVEALSDPRAYRLEGISPPPSSVEVVETHISWLFLTGEYVYKVKKPVDLGFVDFTTRDRRWFYCEEEVSLNRRISPDIYLGVVEVQEDDGEVVVGGPGRTIEHAVKMRQLPREKMLDALLVEGKASVHDVRAVASRVAEFHASLIPLVANDALVSVDALAARIAENFAEAERYVGAHLDEATFLDVRAYSTEAMAVLRPLMERRARQGRVVDGHGDLHAAQVCLTGEGVEFIDCVEFNPAYRIGDVALEIAFMAMDLDHAGRPDLAEAYVDAYVEATGDTELRTLLGLSKSYRAFVRGKVTSYRTATMELSESEKREVAASAAAYYALARSYALASLPSPTLYVVMGLSGTGKSTLAHALAEHWGLGVAVSDVTRKELAGLAPANQGGEELYTPAMDRRTYARLLEMAGEALGRGESFILDATFRDPAQRALTLERARDAGVAVRVLLCDAPPDEVRRRLDERAVQGGDASDATWAVYQGQAAGWAVPTDLAGIMVRVDMAQPVRDALADAVSGIYRLALA